MSVLPNGFIGTIFRTREYERWFVLFFLVCGLLNGFMGAIFRTREYERWFVLFWGCRLPDDFTGTISRTRDYGGVCLFPFAEFGLFSMATRVRFFVPASTESACSLF